MNKPAQIVICCALAVCTVRAAAAQATVQVARTPVVTADAETWYLSGQPITHAGRFYYPAGPRVHFNPYEMVRSGDFLGIPLYARTTIEPYSLVFVPLSGGVMQPYERRRDGDLAGTVGSSAPSFPVAAASESSLAEWTLPRQAPAPPQVAERTADDEETLEASAPVAMIGSGDAPPRTRTSGDPIARPFPPTPGSASLPPAGVARRSSENAVFITYDNAKWFNSGPPVPFDATRLVQIGETHGFPVYAERGNRSTIYVPVTRDSIDAVSHYSRR